MMRFTPLALSHEGSLERSAPPWFTLLALSTLRNEGRHEGSFKGPLTSRSLTSATFRRSVPVPLYFQFPKFRTKIANPVFCAFSRRSHLSRATNGTPHPVPLFQKFLIPKDLTPGGLQNF